LRLRAETRLNLTEIRRRLDPLGEPELEAWLREQPLPPALARVLAANPSDASGSPAQPPTPTPTPTQPAQLSAIEPSAALIEHWQRIRLEPTLELLIRADASPDVHAAALRIYADYAAKSG